MRDIALITIDSLRYDGIYSEGEVRDGLEFFSRLSEDGTVYHEAWTTGSTTVDSFPSIIGGTYPWEFSSSRKGFEPKRPHVAEMLSDAGYSTAAFHSNPYLDERFGYARGFEEYHTGGFEGSSAGVMKYLQSIITRNQFTDRLAYRTMNLLGKTTGIDPRGKPYTSAEQLNALAEKWFSNTDSPRFVWIHYMDVHNPWYPNDGTISEDISERRLIRLFYKARDAPDSLSQEDLKILRLGYEGSIQSMDRDLSKIYDALTAEMDDRLIAVVSDHGELFGEDGNVLHPASVHPKLLRVPFIIDSTPEQPVDQGPVSTVDILPTMLDFAGVEVPALPGKSLFEPPEDRILFAEAGDRTSGQIRMIKGKSSEAYSIDKRGGQTQVPKVVVSHLDRIDKTRGNDIVKSYDESDIEEQLNALGYK